MIKVPATPAGLDALEELAAAGITLNVTLIFSERQYKIARDNVWRGAQRRKNGLDGFKSVYSIFVSRRGCLHREARAGSVAGGAGPGRHRQRQAPLEAQPGILEGQKNLKLQQEIIFASTGTKKPTDPPDKYVEALAGSDIQTNPPATNDAVEKLNKTTPARSTKCRPRRFWMRSIRRWMRAKMEKVLMEEGTEKFADPQHALLKLIGEKRVNWRRRSK